MDSLDTGACFANNVRIISKKYIRETEFGDDDDGKVKIETNNDGMGMGTAEHEDEYEIPKTLSSIQQTNTNQNDDEDYVPSRIGVKKISGKSCQDAVRKSDLETRRKKLQESMAGSMDNSGIGNAARSRSQFQSAARLSTIHHPATLPEGVTLRDDPMTKTKAFLVHLPDLV